MVVHAEQQRSGIVLWFNVDPGYPNRWREEPYLSEIRRRARYGLSTGRYQTKVEVGNRRWIVLPTKEVEFALNDNGITINQGNGNWEFIKTKSEEEAKRIGAGLDQLHEAVSRMSAEERLSLLDGFEHLASDDPLTKKRYADARQSLIEFRERERNNRED